MKRWPRKRAAGNRRPRGLRADTGQRHARTLPRPGSRADTGARRPAAERCQRRRGTKLDEKQYGLCRRSLRTGEKLRVDDMLVETRWGDYPVYAAACEIRSSLSLPIAAQTHTVGALDLYAAPPGAFRHAGLTALRALAAQAMGVTALSQRDYRHAGNHRVDAAGHAASQRHRPSPSCVPPPSTATSNSATCAPN
ncbi:GAF domain-containing protein [Streptomyces sp. LUP47B]|uniref:GAF domain-containing protein n=1 Tax=Streptomyces sp. LUP47B TaxID=1890286 RepID=UPI0035230AB6